MLDQPRHVLMLQYAAYAQEYHHRSAPYEHIFRDSTGQARQRMITLESLDLVRARHPEVHIFNELLVQYPKKNRRRPQRILPDNMVVLSDKPIKARWSYDVPLQNAPIFWVMDYYSHDGGQKDYQGIYYKCERELKVRYYLIVNTDDQELSLFQLGEKRYAPVPPNEHGRYPIPELELEVALFDQWARFWFRGELLPLPADLQRQLDNTRQLLEIERQRADQETQRAEKEKQACLVAEQELERLRQQLSDLRERTGES